MTIVRTGRKMSCGWLCPGWLRLAGPLEGPMLVRLCNAGPVGLGDRLAAVTVANALVVVETLDTEAALDTVGIVRLP